jgi:four helix bundle protein
VSKKIRTHNDLDVYKTAYGTSMSIFWLSKSFPKEEVYSLTSQIRRSSRSVSSSICEAWRKRRYTGAFISKLSDAETEAAETQVWIQYAVDCKYIDRVKGVELYRTYDKVLATLVGMITHPESWVLGTRSEEYGKE